MTWANRLRLLGGFLVVLVIVAGSTLVLNQREGQAASRSAAIEAVSYSVGSDYAGTVIDQYVAEGETVEKGDRLLAIQSATLLGALDSDKGVPESTAYTVTPEGVLTLIATEPGIVSNIEAQVGGFVGAGEALATVDRSGSLFVTADFELDPYNFARIDEGARVEIVLPDHSRVEGTVSTVRVDTVDGQADAEVEVVSEELATSTQGGLIAPGTPVTAIMHLRDEGPLAGLKSSVFQLLEQVGI